MRLFIIIFSLLYGTMILCSNPQYEYTLSTWRVPANIVCDNPASLRTKLTCNKTGNSVFINDLADFGSTLKDTEQLVHTHGNLSQKEKKYFVEYSGIHVNNFLVKQMVKQIVFI